MVTEYTYLVEYIVFHAFQRPIGEGMAKYPSFMCVPILINLRVDAVDILSGWEHGIEFSFPAIGFVAINSL